MKKHFLFILLIIAFISACEKDDFCIQNPVTPSLVIDFYNNTNRETLKDVTTLYVSVDGKDSIYEGSRENSITIPLNTLTNETIYNFSDGTNVDKFTISYTTEEIYVSRSCGYKVIFNDVTFISENNWILGFTPSNLTTIDNQDETHIQIFH